MCKAGFLRNSGIFCPYVSMLKPCLCNETRPHFTCTTEVWRLFTMVNRRAYIVDSTGITLQLARDFFLCVARCFKNKKNYTLSKNVLKKKKLNKLWETMQNVRQDPNFWFLLSDWRNSRICFPIQSARNLYRRGSESRTRKLRLHYGSFVWGNFNMAD